MGQLKISYGKLVTYMNDGTSLEVLGKLDERNTWSIIWVTLEQAKLILYLYLYN